MMSLQQFNELFKKTKNNTVGSVTSKMLNCISKMSSGKSELIANHYGSVRNLVGELTSNNDFAESRDKINSLLVNEMGFKRVDGSVIKDFVNM